MAFSSDFIIKTEAIHANEKIHFQNDSKTGLLIDSNFLQIDGNVNKEDLDLSNYIVSSISKIQWSFSDGYFYNTDEVVHKFKESKTENVTLKIWSEAFTYLGNTFYFTYSSTKLVEVESRFYKFIKDKYPIYDDVSSPELDDLIKSAGKFFDRMHADVSGLTNFIDIKRIDPEYLEYWALTLGHTEYVKKVGYKLTTNDFNNYDIFDKINLGTATREEIDKLRAFLIYSSDLFKNKGTPQNIVNFLRFFDVESKIKDLWTKTWSVQLYPSIEETFNGYDSFEDNQLELKWDRFLASSFDNSSSHFVKTFNSIILDSYHTCEKIEYPTDQVGTVATSGSKFGWVEFELSNNIGLHASPACIKQILRDDGTKLINEEEDDLSKYIDIVPNVPPRFNINNYSVLRIDPSVLKDSDRLSILYDIPNDNKKECIVSTVTKKVKDFDVKVSFKNKQETVSTNLYRVPDNEIFITFRGIKNNLNTSSDYDDLYKFSVNTDRSTFSLSKIVYSESINDYLTQHISLSYNNDEVYEPVIIYPETSSISASEVFVVSREKQYEILLMVNGETLSAYIREDINKNKVLEDIADFKGNNDITGVDEVEWVPLIENFSFDVAPRKVKTIDSMGNEIYSENYSVNYDAGYYGFGSKDGIVEITGITLNNLDPDERLYNTVEKELELKPKLLENIPYSDKRMDNYEDTQKYFTKTISTEIAPNTQYTVTSEESTSLDTLIADKAPVSQSLGTRFTVNFDSDWITNNFTNDADVVNKVMLPLGSQKGWFLPEQKILSTVNYSSYNESSGAPGFFSADLVPTLGDYSLEPSDNFSSVTRDNIDSLTLTINSRLKQYLDFRKDGFIFDGVWEEVYPLSNTFDNLTRDIILDDSSIFSNKMFVPITVDIPEGTRVVGVKFRNCDYIKSLINRYGTEFNKEVTIWGSFVFHVPCNTTQYRPSSYTLEDSDKFPGNQRIVVFVPLGILNEGILNYSLGREFIEQCDNYPTLIELNGVFAKLNTDKVTFSDSTITIITKNPYESVEKGLSVNYYVSGKIGLTTNLSTPISFDTNKRNNIFTLDLKPREFLSNLSDPADFKWWTPTEVWRKRDFDIQEVDLEEDISSGLNFTDKSVDPNNSEKLFYGKQFKTTDPAIRSMRLKLTDGAITPNTIYYIKAKIKISYSGFSFEQLNSLSESDRNNIKIGGEKYTKDLLLAPVKVCKEVYIPISWYGNEEISGLDSSLQYANFIQRSFKGNGTITLTPYGLMTEVLNDKPISNINVLLNISEVSQFVSESTWNHNSWNKYFVENLEVIEVIEKIPSQYYNLFDKYIIMAESNINIGANLEFVYDSADLEWDVLKNFSYFINNHVNDDLVFDIPYDVSDIYEWNANIRNVYLNRYIIDESYYTVGNGVITLGTNDVLTKLTGGELVGKFNFDYFFDKDRIYETIEDDFNITRQINWIPYESNSSEIYENMKRIPSKNLLLGLPASNTESFDIVVKDNIHAFRSLNTNSLYPFEGRQSGTRVNNRSVNISQNEPNARRIFMVDNDNYIFDISADVYFDSKLNEIKNYRGKKFEIVLKANETFDSTMGKNIINNYYYAGIGSFDFDVALGVSQYNKETLKNESSFLAGFGDYNTKNIKSNTWYRLRCIVTNDYIRVLFHPKDEAERLVLNYFINKDYQQDTSRYLSGNFEELVYNITGLDKLNIIYPATVGENTNEKFVRRYLNEALIPAVRPTGSMCGFRIYNEYTYMTNVHYKYLSEDGYQVGNAFDTNNLSDIITYINKKY